MMTLAQAAEWCGGELLAPAGKESIVMTGATIDTRELSPGDLFVALPGTQVDGASFIADAARLGASAALCAKSSARSDSPIPQIAARDPVRALGLLARRWREKVSKPVVVAITGTCGKTTAREMAAHILRLECGADAVLSSRRNYNNHLGAPLTILRLRPSHKAAVVELGMNHSGEIAALTKIVKPNLGVILNAGRGHLETLGTVENVARAKGEMMRAMPADSSALLNAGDPHYSMWVKMAGSRRIWWVLPEEGKLVLYYFGGARVRTMRLRENVSAAVETTLFMGRMAALIATDSVMIPEPPGYTDVILPPGRMEEKRAKGGAVLIDSTYNSNPDSALAALDALRGFGPPDGMKIAALGDMLELGGQSAALHEEVGVRAAACGAAVFAFGELSKRTAKAARDNDGRAEHFSSKAELIRALEKVDRPGAAILVKGSRGMKMEEVVAALESVHPPVPPSPVPPSSRNIVDGMHRAMKSANIPPAAPRVSKEGD